MRRDPVLIVLAGLVALALVALPVATHAPNRLAGGVAIGAGAAWGPVWAGALLLAVAGLRIGGAARRWLVIAGAALVTGGVVSALGQDAAAYARAAPTPAARSDAGAGAWVALIAAVLATRQAGGRVWPVALAIAPACLIVASGGDDTTALGRAFFAERGVLGAAVVRHAVLVAVTMAVAVPLGLALGIWAWRARWAGGAVLPLLGLSQTVPALAIFGLLLPVVGVGLVPAVIALVLYALLPVARGVAVGLSSVPEGPREAARGLGLSRWQVFTSVEVPLGWPVALSGVRVAAVQAVGLAVLASLIGAGGLGSVIFEGLFANALDTVVLGVVPVVAMAGVIDGVFGAVGA